MTTGREGLKKAGSPQQTVAADARAPLPEAKKITSHRQYILRRVEVTLGAEDPTNKKVAALQKLWQVLEGYDGNEQDSKEQKNQAGRQARLIAAYQNHFAAQIAEFLKSADGKVFSEVEGRILGKVGVLYVAAYLVDMLEKFDWLAARALAESKQAKIDSQFAHRHVAEAQEQFEATHTLVANFVTATKGTTHANFLSSDQKEEKNPRQLLDHALDGPKQKLAQLQKEYQSFDEDLKQATGNIAGLDKRKNELLEKFIALRQELQQVKFPGLLDAENYLKQHKTATQFDAQEKQIQKELAACEACFAQVRTDYHALNPQPFKAVAYTSDDLAILNALLYATLIPANFKQLHQDFQSEAQKISALALEQTGPWMKFKAAMSESIIADWDRMAADVQLLYGRLLQVCVQGVLRVGVTEKDHIVVSNNTAAVIAIEEAHLAIGTLCQTLTVALPQEEKLAENTAANAATPAGFRLRLFNAAKPSAPVLNQQDAQRVGTHAVTDLPKLDAQLTKLKTELAQADLAHRTKAAAANAIAIAEFENQLRLQEQQRQQDLAIVQEQIETLVFLNQQRIAQQVAINFARVEEGRDIRAEIDRANADRLEQQRLRRVASNARFVQYLEPRAPSSAPIQELKAQDSAPQPAESAPMHSFKLPSSTRTKAASAFTGASAAVALIWGIVIVASNPAGWVALMFLAAVALLTLAIGLARKALKCDRINKMLSKHQNKEYVNSQNEHMPAQQALLIQDNRLAKRRFGETTRNFMMNRGVIVKNASSEHDGLGDTYTPCTAIHDPQLPIYINRHSGAFFLRYHASGSRAECTQGVNEQNFDREVERYRRAVSVNG